MKPLKLLGLLVIVSIVLQLVMPPICRPIAEWRAAQINSNAKPDWKRHKFEGISLELPSQPEKNAISLPEAVTKEYLIKQTTSRFNDLQVVVTYVYTHSDYDAENGIRAALENLKTQPFIKEVTSPSFAEATMTGQPARKASATFLISGAPGHFSARIFKKGENTWTVMVSGPVNSALEIEGRVFSSIQITE